MTPAPESNNYFTRVSSFAVVCRHGSEALEYRLGPGAGAVSERALGNRACSLIDSQDRARSGD